MMITIILIFIISITSNILQFSKISNYNKQEKLYNKTFENDFNSLIISFGYYNGTNSVLTNENAIKNSVGIVGNLNTIRGLTSYKQSKLMSEMLLYLSEFFVLNSNEFVNKNIDKIKPQLYNISKNLTDEKLIKDLNVVLWKMVSQKEGVL